MSDVIDAEIDLIRKCLLGNNAGAAVERIDYVKAEISRLRADLAAAREVIKNLRSYHTDYYLASEAARAFLARTATANQTGDAG